MQTFGIPKKTKNKRWSWSLLVGYVLMFSQQLGTGDVKDSDDARVEATREDLLTGMEGHGARAVL